MAHIQELTPNPFWIKHPDWLNGYPQQLREMAHNIGLAAAKRYYMECEAKAIEIDARYPLDFALNPFTWIQNYLIAVERASYQRNYILIYEDAALAACKQIERAEAVLNEAKQRILDLAEQANRQVEDAKKYVENNFINPIKSQLAQFQPQINQIKSNITGISQQANQALAGVTDAYNRAQAALSSAQNALNSASNAVQQAVSAKNLSDQASKAASDAQTKIQQAFSDLNAKAQQISDLSKKAQQASGEISSLASKAQDAATKLGIHSNQISDLYQRLSSLSGQQINPPSEQSSSFFDELRKQLQNLI